MSGKEINRGVVLARVQRGELGLRGAAALLGVSYRQAKRLARRYREGGAVALVHGHVGRPSNHARPTLERSAVLALIGAEYGGTVARGPGQRFGPTLVAEHLWCDHGRLVPVPTLRRWMREAGLWSPMRRPPRAHRRRARRAHFGELLQLDGSFHDWLEGRGPDEGRRTCLMTLIDDATGHALGQLHPEETTWAAVAVLRAWITAHGVPRALYVDAKSVYVRAATSAELIAGRVPYTQFGRMCAALGITLIVATSPQAKGRVERVHGTNQDRLVKKLRHAGIATMAAANAYLATTYLSRHNARFAVAPASADDFHLPRDRRVRDADVFCLETPRVLGKDWVVRYDNRALQIQPRGAARRYCAPGTRLLVREQEDGALRVLVQSADGHTHALEWQPAAIRTTAPRAGVSVAAAPTPDAAPSPAHAGRDYWHHATTVDIARHTARKHYNAQRKADAEARRHTMQIPRTITILPSEP